jgi:hypothetical protein
MNTLLTKLKAVFNKAKSFKITMPKIKIPDFKPVFGKIKSHLVKVLPVLKKIGSLIFKAIKGFISWFWKAVKESIAQVWTLLGFFIAWLTLTGTAQQIVGIATIMATILWLVTIPLREEKEE